jgi:SAM-dependent methyltransferase
MYEAGVAEIYDYSMTGPDPLRELIQHFGLQTIPMDAEQVMLDGELLNDVAGMRRRYGAKTADAIEAFRKRCAGMISPTEYYEGVGAQDNEHPWAFMTAEELLDREVEDPVAKRFFKVMARSDIATETHNTNGLNALKNFVMDIDGYIGLYSIQNGNEQLITCLRSEVDADIQLNHRVLKVGKTEGGRYQLNMMNGKGPETRDFDLVMMCLPHNWLATVGWEGEELRKSMVKHVAYFDRPAHYLRISILFDEPFWGEKIPGAWFMSEAFGGCCVYNEGARHDVGRNGVLNWLIAGSDALAYVNLTDQQLVDAALKSLPASLGNAREHFVEGKIHRWLSSVNAVPGGLPVRDVATNHRPEPKDHPGIVLVGDYLFDSTLNGLLDSSDAATDIVVTETMRLRHARTHAGQGTGKIDRAYFDNYRGVGPYSEVWDRFTSPQHLTDLIKTVWNKTGNYKLLVAGSASGELVGALRERGIDAYGIENNRAIHAKTPEALKPFNVFGSIADMPFADEEFDFVFETSLCHVSERQVKRAVRELHRVVKTGLVFGSVTSDLEPALIDRYDLLRGVKKLGTWWEWSEIFFNNGFDLSMNRKDCMDEVWAATIAAGKGPESWYTDPESLRYSFFDKTEIED